MTTVCKRRVIFGQFMSFFVRDNDKMGQRVANPTDAVDWAAISNYLLSTKQFTNLCHRNYFTNLFSKSQQFLPSKLEYKNINLVSRLKSTICKVFMFCV